MTWLDDLTLNTVIVHLDGLPSVRGIKRAVYDDGILLRDAHTLEDPPQMLNGDFFAPRERFLGMQIIEAK